MSKAVTLHDQASGISPEDRREILARIDGLTRKNRIGAEGAAFAARSRGVLFPVLVNLAAAALTAGALWALSTAFREREAEVSRAGASLSSAEGKLIRELKRDSESRLSQKDQEIADMQARIASLDADRSKLLTSFESRLSAREAELRGQLKAELERERERLIAQGLSETVIQERLKRFEEERNAAFRRELAAFQKRIDEERAAADAGFAKLRDEYRVGMASLNDERKRIQDEARRREDELRSSLEAQTKALERETAQAAAEREKARAELARAEEARKTERAAEERVVGLYVAVRTAVQERRFEEAAVRAAALRAYLNDPAVTSAAALQVRRPADLFAAEALAFMARTELERASLDTSLLLRQAELVSAVRGAAASARTALKAGNAAAGEKAYADALRTIPEILEAHDYFAKRAQEVEDRRREKANAASRRASEALDRGDYDAAAASYREAASLLFVDEASAKALADGILRLSVSEYARSRTEADTKAAQAPLARAFGDLGAGKWSVAVVGFSSVLSSYPSARQRPEALKGIEEAFAGLSREAERKAAEDRKRIRDLEAETMRLSAELADTKAAGEKDRLRVAEENEIRAAELQRLLEEARRESANAAAVARTAENGAPAAAPAELEKLRSENAALASAAQRYDTLVSSYSSYRDAEDAARARKDSGSLVEARSRFDSFLDDPQTRGAFPDLRERIARYEKEYLDANQTEGLYNAMTVAENALALRDPATRKRYFDDLAERYKNDEGMSAYIETLRRGLR